MEMNLVMPNNYVELEQEEMMYVDGGGFGRQWFNSVGFVGGVIDVALLFVGVGIAAYQGYALKRFLKQNARKWVKTVTPVIMKYVGVGVSGFLSAAIDVAMIVTGNSIGGLIASGLNYIDGNRWDGYIFA